MRAAQVFHGNGWYRFRTEVGGPTRWCNSCGNLGQSDFGAGSAVDMLEEGGGSVVPPDGVGLMHESGYYMSALYVSLISCTRAGAGRLVCLPYMSALYVGCCLSRIDLSVYPSVFDSIYQSIHLYICVHIYVCMHVSICTNIHTNRY